jgi:SP family arabinose:H+ symporter-like MFS transporter
LIATVAALGGFLFGYDLSIISGVMLFLKPEFGLTPGQVGLAIGSALLGCMAGQEGAWRELLRPGMRFAMLIACSLAVFQQITGASILTMYMPTVFQEAGFDKPSDAILQNVLMSVWYVICTVVALAAVDRLGRKPLLLLGTMGMTVGMALLGALFYWRTTGGYVVLTMFLVMGAYLVSLAPLAWLIMSEIFPNRLRGKAMAVASVFVWTASFLTANFFPPMVERFKTALGTPAMAFWIYAVVSAAAFLFSWIVVPETKGRTLEEIGASWDKKNKPCLAKTPPQGGDNQEQGHHPGPHDSQIPG